MDRRNFLVGTGTLAAVDGMGIAAAAGQEPIRETILAQAAGTEQPVGKPTIEQRCAAFAASLKYDDLPRDVVAGVKRLLIDTLACGFGAIGAPPAQIAEQTFRKTFGGPQMASILGGPDPISSEGAALVNGVLVRYLDLNDIYVGKDPCHPSECIPAALACCEESSRNGRRLVEAIVVGYETQLALVEAYSFADRGFHSLSCAGFAVPLMAAKTWDLTPEQMTQAMGIAGPRLLTLLAINRGPISMIKALPYAHAAMDGLFATRLAAAGFTGASDVIAWFAANVQTKRADSEFILELGKYKLTKVGLKRFPLQFELQTIAEAGVSLHGKIYDRIDAISQIIVETYPSTIERTADPTRYEPKTRETADHSLPVCLSLALIDGDVTIEQFDKGRWRAPEVLSLAQKVVVKVSDKLVAAAPRGGGAVVRVTLTDGKVAETTIEIADGDPRRPMSAAALEHKFLQFTVPHLGEALAKNVLRLIDGLEELDDVGVLMKAMRRA